MMDVLSVLLVCSLVLALGCALYFMIPDVLVRGFNEIVKYIFYTRNQALQAVFGALVTLGHVVLIIDMLPVLTRFEPDGSHVFLPITLLFTNFAFYQLCCLTDPGRITTRNVDSFVGAYKYDGVLYKTGAVCRTCKTVKPARSKHCTFCNRCVHRFDHHCLWTNSCIGAFNLRHFLLFLLSLVTMCANGVLLSGRCLLLLVTNFKLLDKSYKDDVTGQLHPITYPMLAQGLFMQFPRVVVLLGSLLVLLMLVIPFTAYHLYLVAINTTTNERFKLMALRQRQVCNGDNCADDHTKFPASRDDDCTRSASNRDYNHTKSLSSEGGDRTESPSSRSDNCSKSPSSGDDDLSKLSLSRGDINNTNLPSCKSRLYNQGLVRNFCEVFFPQMRWVKVSEPNSPIETPNLKSRDKRD